MDEALRDWVSDPDGTYYCLGSAIGPHPYPFIVRELQSVIGREARQQLLDAIQRLPDAAVACVGGGSNAIGLFHPSSAMPGWNCSGSKRAETATASARTRPPLPMAVPACCTVAIRSCCRTTTDRCRRPNRSQRGSTTRRSGPSTRCSRSPAAFATKPIRDDEALEALAECCEAEGILPAIESAHALAGARKWAVHHRGRTILVCLSGRGDKDLQTLEHRLLAGREATP